MTEVSPELRRMLLVAAIQATRDFTCYACPSILDVRRTVLVTVRNTKGHVVFDRPFCATCADQRKAGEAKLAERLRGPLGGVPTFEYLDGREL